MNLEIHKLVPSDEKFGLFAEVKKSVYKENSIGLLQPDELNSAFLVSCFVVTENDIPVGRLAIYNNPELYWKGEKACCIGNFECVNDSIIALLLITEAQMWAITNDFRVILGPMNGSTWENYRFGTNQDSPLFLSESYHPLYYNDLFTECGFEVILNYQSRIEYGITTKNEKVAHKIADSVLDEIVIREFDVSRLDEELGKLFSLVTAAFERNTLYTSISWETFYKKYSGVIKQLGTRYVFLAEQNNEPIAFVFAFQNHLETTKKQIVFKTVARKFGKEYAGIGHVVALEVLKRAVEDGMEDAIHAFMIYDATSTEISENFNSEPYKEYALYAKRI